MLSRMRELTANFPKIDSEVGGARRWFRKGKTWGVFESRLGKDE